MGNVNYLPVEADILPLDGRAKAQLFCSRDCLDEYCSQEEAVIYGEVKPLLHFQPGDACAYCRSDLNEEE